MLERPIIIYLALRSVQGLSGVQCLVFSEHCTECTVQCALYQVQCATVHCTECNLKSAEFTGKCTVFGVHC